jgi:ribosomal-protein-alanine N-acetyltransferase
MTCEEARRIRSVQLSELAAVHAIERMSFPNPWPLHIFQQELSHSWSRLWGVFTTGSGAPVAFLLFWLVYDEVHILNIATHPRYRRQSIAKTLLARLQEESLRVGARYLTLEVRPSNAAALNLYRTQGFEVVGVRPRYYSDNGEDALVMVKSLNGDPLVRPNRPVSLRK